MITQARLRTSWIQSTVVTLSLMMQMSKKPRTRSKMEQDPSLINSTAGLSKPLQCRNKSLARTTLVELYLPNRFRMFRRWMTKAKQSSRTSRKFPKWSTLSHWLRRVIHSSMLVLRIPQAEDRKFQLRLSDSSLSNGRDLQAGKRNQIKL